MDTEAVICTDVQGIRQLTLNRTNKANALSADMLGLLAHAFHTAPDDDIRAIVLRSTSSRVFSAGADIGEFMAGEGAFRHLNEALYRLLTAMHGCPVPTIVLAQGVAAGAGAALLALADVAIVDDSLAISCPEIRFHMYPYIVQLALETKMSVTQARQLCLNAETLDSQDARQLALVTTVVRTDSLEQALEFYTCRHAALALLKTHYRTDADITTFRQKLEEYGALAARNFSQPGVYETINAYLKAIRS